MPNCLRCCAVLLLILGSCSAFADIVVNSAADEDTMNSSCSLREAIMAVNAQADHNGCTYSVPALTVPKITFAITGTGVHTITLGTDLPSIVRPVFVDATTQTGTVCTPVPNLRIEIAGNAGLGTGVHLGTGSTGSTVRGLAIYGFSSSGGAGIEIDSDLATIGCTIAGMDASATTVHANDYGIAVYAKFATIGEASSSAWFPNVISGNNTINIDIPTGADNTVVAGNYVGVDHTGLLPEPTGYGIQIGASGTHIGAGFADGPPAHQRNVIGVSSNGPSSVEIDLEGASDTIISGNYVGVGADGHTVLPIGIGAGIVVNSSINTLIGCDGNGSWDDCRNVVVVPDGASGGISVGLGSTGTAIVSNFINVAANGITSLASTSLSADGIDFNGDTLVARNVISSKGSDIAIGPPDGSSPTAVFLNATAAGSGGAVLDSSDNCLPDTDAYRGVNIFTYGTATTTPTTFENNWWGAINGPQPAGSGAYADAAVDAVPFLAAPSPYCGFDRIFANGFE